MQIILLIHIFKIKNIEINKKFQKIDFSLTQCTTRWPFFKSYFFNKTMNT